MSVDLLAFVKAWRSKEWLDKHMEEIEPIDAWFTPQYACADELESALDAMEREQAGEAVPEVAEAVEEIRKRRLGKNAQYQEEVDANTDCLFSFVDKQSAALGRAREALKKTLTCGLDSSVRQLVIEALKEPSR
jgi:hypothetical protein